MTKPRNSSAPAGTRGQRLAVLLLAAGAPFLPHLAAAMLLAVLAWWSRRVWPRELAGRLRPVGFALAALLLGLSSLPTEFLPRDHDAADRLQKGYSQLWNGLEETARRVATDLGTAPSGETSRRELFARLESLLGDDETLTLMLLDSGGEAAAWAGHGLVHEPASGRVPALGAGYEPGHGAVTFLYTVPLTEERRPWHVVAGKSLGHKELPFAPDHPYWWLGSAESEPGPGIVRLTVEGSAPNPPPALFIRWSDKPKERWRQGLRAMGQGGILFLVLALILPPLIRRTQGKVAEGRTWDFGLDLFLGMLSLGWLPGLSTITAGLLALAVALADLALEVRLRPPGLLGELLGGLVPLALVAAAEMVQALGGRSDLALAFSGPWETLALRLTFFLLAFGLFALAAGSPAKDDDRPALLALIALLAAAALHDHTLMAAFLLTVGGASVVRWARGGRWRSQQVSFGALLLFSTLTGAGAWETADRESFRREVEQELLPKLAPPRDEELNDLLLSLEDYFSGQDLPDRLATGGHLDTADLAFVLWRGSPLALQDGLSTLVIEPFAGTPSSFAFGLALDENLELIPEPDRWQVPASPAWRRALLFGEAELTEDGKPWGLARYSFLPRPGFRLPVNEVDELEVALLRGESHSKTVDGLPRPLRYGLYGPDGIAIESPWEEAPPLASSFLDSEEATAWLETPEGDMWAVKSEENDGIEVLFLPLLGPLDGLERVGIHSMGTLWVLALVGAILLAVSLPGRAMLEAAQHSVRSYSQRMILVYTVLLLVPLITLNLILLRSFENRLRQEQRANAEAAIGSARHFLFDYLLGLKPGFGIETQVNRSLLEWISGVVQHQVNLYWDSRVFASSQQELFTAGLSTRRIPGEIYNRLALEGYDQASRTRQSDGLEYLELYAPLDAPGLGLGQQGLFLSVPLLEQEEGVARELAALRRRAVLVTTALFLLLMWVGSRLAASFTRPILALIDGTRAIAGGADRLGFRPREPELSALSTAIDEMAGKIAEGRRRLLYEKRLVETIVEHITSGVLLLDKRGEILLLNRVATDLLGVAEDQALRPILEKEERWRPILQFLDEVDQESEQATVRLSDSAGESRDWTLSWVPLPDLEGTAAILVVDDDTEVLRGQRLEAWAEMARIIAHEIKNPLTPIQLSTEHLRQVWQNDGEGFDLVFQRCTDNILRQVEELRDLASDFSIYSRIPRAELVADDLQNALEEVTEVYRDAGRAGGGVAIEVRWTQEDLETRFDRKLLGRALRNLIENALRANAGQGTVEVTLDRGDEEKALIRVADSGPGVDPKMLRRIFEPYFSTHETGTGLGLAITRRIVEEHGGEIEARNRSQGGLEVRIQLPLAMSETGEAGSTES